MQSNSLLHEIITALILYIQAELGIIGIIPPPEVTFVPQEQLKTLTSCTGGCRNLHGWFSYTHNAIYMGLDNDVYGNLYDRSVLLHELVHYIQHHQEKPRLDNECETWKAREIQAYGVQYKWLRHNRVPIRPPSYNTRLAHFKSIDCSEAARE